MKPRQQIGDKALMTERMKKLHTYMWDMLLAMAAHDRAGEAAAKQKIQPYDSEDRNEVYGHCMQLLGWMERLRQEPAPVEGKHTANAMLLASKIAHAGYTEDELKLADQCCFRKYVQVQIKPVQGLRGQTADGAILNEAAFQPK